MEIAAENHVRKDLTNGLGCGVFHAFSRAVLADDRLTGGLKMLAGKEAVVAFEEEF